MKRSIINSAKKSKRGRPSVESEAINVRMTVDALKLLDDWRRKQDDLPGRPEAIRRLVEIGMGRAFLSERPATAKTRAASADRAKELAEKTIERVVDPSIPPEEKVVRRRRLVKGPSEFREDRVDQPRPKKR